MPDSSNLEQHARRVEHAREELAADVERLSLAGQDIGRRLVKTPTIVVVCGGIVLVGALFMRRLSRRMRLARAFESAVAPRRSLVRRSFDMLLMALLRQASAHVSSCLLLMLKQRQRLLEKSAPPGRDVQNESGAA